jgi:hypothetical protein
MLLMARASLRRSEVAGLRRSDMHLLGDSGRLGCPVVGAHVHVERRANPNGAWAKSRRPRAVPASQAQISAAIATLRLARGNVVGLGIPRVRQPLPDVRPERPA